MYENLMEEDGRVERTPTEALAEDSRQADGGNPQAEPCEAGRTREAGRGHSDVRDTDLDGPVHPADVTASDDADPGAAI